MSSVAVPASGPANDSRSGNVHTAGSVRAVPERIDSAAIEAGVLAAPDSLPHGKAAAVACRRGSGEPRFPASPLPRLLIQAGTLLSGMDWSVVQRRWWCPDRGRCERA